jgi:hypothetical protein
MMFVSSDMRERSAHAEAVVGETLLSNPDVVKHLGNRAAAFENRVQSLVVANVRHGVVSMPRERKNASDIPLVVASPDESLRAGEGLHRPHRLQARRCQELIRHWRINGQPVDDYVVDNLLGKVDASFDLQLPYTLHQPRPSSDGFAGSTSRRMGFDLGISPYNNVLNGGDELVFLGMPVVGLMMGRPLVRSMPALIHETEHGEQLLNRPVRTIVDFDYDHCFAREADAVAAAASFERALYEVGDDQYRGNPDILGDYFYDTSRSGVPVVGQPPVLKEVVGEGIGHICDPVF